VPVPVTEDAFKTISAKIGKTMNYQAVFFDFDGVILDSVNVKTQAFASMFRQYGPEIEKAVVDYHLANGGVSRYEKFKYYYNILLDRRITVEELQYLDKKFSKMVIEKVLNSEFVPGALETLRELKNQKKTCFIVSGTPDNEIKNIVKNKGLDSYFQEVHGSPQKKIQIINDISKRYNLTLSKCLFIGDAITDYNAALECETKFLGIVKDKKFSPFPQETWITNHITLGEIE
jgi:HAD superfamily hydrolase (TIGR01549 family)